MKFSRLTKISAFAAWMSSCGAGCYLVDSQNNPGMDVDKITITMDPIKPEDDYIKEEKPGIAAPQVYHIKSEIFIPEYKPETNPAVILHNDIIDGIDGISRFLRENTGLEKRGSFIGFGLFRNGSESGLIGYDPKRNIFGIRVDFGGEPQEFNLLRNPNSNKYMNDTRRRGFTINTGDGRSSLPDPMLEIMDTEPPKLFLWTGEEINRKLGGGDKGRSK